MVNETTIRMMQLAQNGYPCSQILIMLGLELKKESNPSLVRAVAGLAKGCGTETCTCGALAGGCCLIGLLAVKGSEDEDPAKDIPLMTKELVTWFEETYSAKYGGTHCRAILETDDGAPVQKRCFSITEAVFFKCLDILTAYEINLDY